MKVNNPQRAEGERTAGGRRGREGAGISTRDAVIRFEGTFTVLEWREGRRRGDFRDISLDCPFRGSLEGNQTYRVVFFNFQEREKKINKIKEKKRKGRCLLVRSMKRIKVFFFFFFFEGHAKRVGEQELGLSFRYRCGKKSMPLYFEWISYFGCTTTARNFCNFLFKFPQLSNFVALRPITTSDVFCEFFRFDFFFFCRMLFRPNVVAVVWILNF